MFRSQTPMRPFRPQSPLQTPVREREKRVCRVCGCVDENCMECVRLTGAPCVWMITDGPRSLCSACHNPRYIFAGRLHEGSPRYQDFMEVFGTDTVPLVTPHLQTAGLPGFSEPAQVYLLSLRSLRKAQYDRLVAYCARQFDESEASVREEMQKRDCFPLLPTDMFVSVDGRVFL